MKSAFFSAARAANHSSVSELCGSAIRTRGVSMRIELPNRIDFGKRKVAMSECRVQFLSVIAGVVVLSLAHSLANAATVTSFNSDALVAGTETVLGFQVNQTNNGDGLNRLLVVDPSVTVSNTPLKTTVNDGNDFDLDRLRFFPNDGTGTATFNITNNAAASSRLFLGLMDVDGTDTSTVMSGGSPLSASLLFGSGWEFDDDYVYPEEDLNYDEGTGVLSVHDHLPESNPEPMVFFDVTNLSDVSINPNNTTSLISLFVVDGPFLTGEVSIDRGTGAIRIKNDSDAPYNLIGYSLTSNVGAFDQTTWAHIAENTDAPSNGGDGSFDNDDEWTILTAAGSHGDLSEAEFSGGNGAQLAAGADIELGNAWIQNLEEDVQYEVLVSNGAILTGNAKYVGGDGAPYQRSDLDFDGDIDQDDWVIYVGGLVKDLSNLSPAEAYQMGDLDYDGENGFKDFNLFQSDFDAANGAGAFARMVAGVPEPASAYLLILGACSVIGLRIRRNVCTEGTS